MAKPRKKGKKSKMSGLGQGHAAMASMAGTATAFGGKRGKGKRSAKSAGGKNQVPIEVLNKRLVRLNKIVASRPGGHPVG